MTLAMQSRSCHIWVTATSCYVTSVVLLKAWLIILEELKRISLFSFKRMFTNISPTKGSPAFWKNLRLSKSAFRPVGKRQSVSRVLTSTASITKNPFPWHSSLDSAIIPLLSGGLWYWVRPEDHFPSPFVYRSHDSVTGGRSLRNKRDAKRLWKIPQAVLRLCFSFRVITSPLFPAEQYAGIWTEASETSHLSLILPQPHPLPSSYSSEFLFWAVVTTLWGSNAFSSSLLYLELAMSSLLADGLLPSHGSSLWSMVLVQPWQHQLVLSLVLISKVFQVPVIRMVIPGVQGTSQ